MKPSPKDKKRVLNFLDGIQWLFHTNMLDRTLVFADNNEGSRIAYVEYDEPYQRICITLYPVFWELSLAKQRKSILHELAHVITLPAKRASLDLLDGNLVTKKTIDEINEAATSKIENILDALLSGRCRYASLAYKEYLK